MFGIVLPRPAGVCLHGRLSSNVRPRRMSKVARQQNQRLSAWAEYTMRQSRPSQSAAAVNLPTLSTLVHLNAGPPPWQQKATTRRHVSRRHTARTAIVFNSISRPLQPAVARRACPCCRCGLVAYRIMACSSGFTWSTCGRSPEHQRPGSSFHQPASQARAWPNPSFNRSANGGAPGPVWRYAVHFRQPGPGAPPLAPGYLER